MSISLKQVQVLIEKIAPPAFACDWDHTGFSVNLHNEEITGIMICLDVSEDVVRQAVEKRCNLILAHHPLLFRGIHNVDSDTYEGACVRALIENGISLYCAHTSMDASPQGINTYLADVVGLVRRSYLDDTIVEKYLEVAVHVPLNDAQTVRDAMAEAGAGKLGDYTECTYNIEGKGTFRPCDGAHPFLGERGKLETVDEVRVSAICSESDLSVVLSEIRRVHPYEEPAISAICLRDPQKELAGMGIIGELEKTESVRSVVARLKESLSIPDVRISGDLDLQINRIGVCGGAAGDLIEKAARMGAQLFITGEIKHNFYAARTKMVLAEAGHFDTEKCFCKLFADSLQKLMDDVNYNVDIYIANLHRPYVNY